ncbi:MAG: hypothetical protein HY727_06365 [Candidatus Rokubacteria bacterium]|nr:hypothetical protein [Candidatus Rokubacteria bacterium]
MAFGAAEPWPAGGNLVMITHGTNISAWTGVHPAQGEMVVLTPLGDGAFRVAGRLAPTELPE